MRTGDFSISNRESEKAGRWESETPATSLRVPLSHFPTCPLSARNAEPVRLRNRRRRSGGFTLAEVLAALVFMAIVIPVTLQGLRVASRAGSVAERKMLATRLAENKLNELIVTRQWESGSSRGTIAEGFQEYEWELESESWPEDGAMRVLTVRVIVPVQGEDYDVRVSTLVDATQ